MKYLGIILPGDREATCYYITEKDQNHKAIDHQEEGESLAKVIMENIPVGTFNHMMLHFLEQTSSAHQSNRNEKLFEELIAIFKGLIKPKISRNYEMDTAIKSIFSMIGEEIILKMDCVGINTKEYVYLTASVEDGVVEYLVGDAQPGLVYNSYTYPTYIEALEKFDQVTMKGWIDDD